MSIIGHGQLVTVFLLLFSFYGTKDNFLEDVI